MKNTPLHNGDILSHPNDSIEQFRQAMQQAGIVYFGEIIADGKLHRFRVEGHRQGSMNGAYKLHIDNFPAGYFQDFKSGISQKWRYSGNYYSMSHDLIEKIKGINRRRKAEVIERQQKAAKKSLGIWMISKPIIKQSDHAYLPKKRIQPHGSRLYRQALVIPIFNELDQIVNLQFISPEGQKRVLTHARKQGCFYRIGELTDTILIAEGFATGASLHEASGKQAIIAFDCGNLLSVAQNIRKLSPNSEIILCSDNDLSGIGQKKAREAALAVGGKVLIPPVVGRDWNDLIAEENHHV